jgi:ribosomal protein S18 acetylase RimI-like enzyme
MLEYKTFTADIMPTDELKSYIVNLANMLDDEMVEYSKKIYGPNEQINLTNHTVENYKEDFFSIKNASVLLLLADSQPIGYCWWSCTDNYATIMNVYIVKSEQRKGYGTKLLRAVLSRIQNHHPESPSVGLDVIPNNVAAQAFYKSLGFYVDCVSMRYNFEKKPNDGIEPIPLGDDAAPMIILNELYLASLQTFNPIVIIRGPKAREVFQSVWDLARSISTFQKYLHVQSPNALKIRDSWLLATEEDDPDCVDIFRGKSVAALFNLPDAQPNPNSVRPSLLSAKAVGLGRVYSVIEDMNL